MEKYNVLYWEEYFQYKEFIGMCRNKKYDESVKLHNHHIIPKFMHYDNSKENLVLLSEEDHGEAHLLLSKCFDENTDASIGNLRSSRLIKKFAIKPDDLDKIKRTYDGINNPFYGKTHTAETKSILSNATKLARTGISYEEYYMGADKALAEKEKRRQGVKNYWASLTDEQRKERTKNTPKGPQPKRYNPARKRLLIDNICFESIKMALEYFEVSRFILFRDYKVVVL